MKKQAIKAKAKPKVKKAVDIMIPPMPKTGGAEERLGQAAMRHGKKGKRGC